ncbi:glycosyltransferase family 4 protein [Halomonas sp. BM-2019]|uniref:glycosyltransferase family 4 protein n=1 Tax=Halomonas sp. BM-2019 TaxID=2811227 RepID=UPI001B3C262B|nr:MAG: glycosyltransferase family 4 protein [Halomonas sp. BM-2019]
MKFLIIAGLSDSLINFRGHLISDLIRRGVEVHAAAPDLTRDCQTRAKLEKKGVIVHDIFLRRTGVNPWHDFLTLIGMIRLMRTIKPDNVMGYTIKPVIFGTMAASLSRCTGRFALITGLGYSFSGDCVNFKHRLISNIASMLYRLSLRSASKVFFQNPDDQALFREKKILNSKTPSVVVNGSGVDIEHFVPSNYPSRVTFLFIARLLIEKGVREYVEAAYQLKSVYPESTFLLVGELDSNPNSITREELDRWIDDGIVSYLGVMDDVRLAFGSSSVFVLPTFYREGIPRTILEALAMGRPVITTDTPGCRETVIDGENGFLVFPRNSGELAHAMRVFLDSPDLVAVMGKRSREEALKKYDVRLVNSSMLKEMGLDDESTILSREFLHSS